MDFQIDKEAGTLRAFSYENSGIGVYNEADPDDPAYEKRAATWQLLTAQLRAVL